MRIAIIIVSFLLTSHAWASGKITAKATKEIEEPKIKYMLGLAINEKIVGSVHYEGWLGHGLARDVEGEEWLKTDQGLAIYADALALQAGVSYLAKPDDIEHGEKSAYAAVSLKLW